METEMRNLAAARGGFSLLLLLSALAGACSETLTQPTEIRLPAGFALEVFAENVPDARSMALSPNGILYVGNRRGDSVYAIEIEAGGRRAGRMHRIASGLSMPNGVAWHEGSLYVAAINRILRYEGIDERLENPPAPVVVVDDLPTDKHHGWKYIAFGPDGQLYVPIGAPCNICDAEGYALIMRMAPDGSNREVVARGVRNSVGFDWHPDSGDFWFTDNGRDMLGDDLPPCELNHLPIAGEHFGYPYCHGAEVSDPEYGSQRPCSEFRQPAMELGPHVAPLGMKFYTGSMFPEAYRGHVFIAEHGSWNRSKKIGYRVTLVRLKEGRAVSYETFADGWLEGEEASGRPVDILQMPDGSLLVSDDMGDRIYRIFYTG